MTDTNNNQKLRVWWIPQIGAETFYVPVKDVLEAKKVMDILSTYDCFCWNNGVRPDFINAGGVEKWDEDCYCWEDWWYEDEDWWTDDIDEYIEFFHPDEDESSCLYNQVKWD